MSDINAQPDLPRPLRDRLRELPPPDWDPWLDDSLYPVGPEDEAELVALATDPDLLEDEEGEDDDYWLAVHARRALAALRSQRAVGALLDAVERTDTDDWLLEDFMELCGRVGGGAVSVLRAGGTDGARDGVGRMCAAEALAIIGERHPGAREACVEALDTILANFEGQEPDFNAVVIGGLARLRATGSASLIRAAFEARRVDPRVVGDWEEVRRQLQAPASDRVPRAAGIFSVPVAEPASGPPLPSVSDLDPAAYATLQRVFEGPEASGPVRSLRELEGFLFSVACVPDVVRPSEWLEFIRLERKVRSSGVDAREVITEVLLLYNEIQQTVNGSGFGPPEGLFGDELLSSFELDASASRWCRGFVLGHTWFEDAWREGTDPDDEDAELALYRLVLSFFASREVAEGFVPDMWVDEDSAREVAGRVRALWPEALVGYAAKGGEVLSRRTAARRDWTVRVDPEDRIGRNDPCPCGSGRKHKRCCGRMTH